MKKSKAKVKKIVRNKIVRVNDFVVGCSLDIPYTHYGEIYRPATATLNFRQGSTLQFIVKNNVEWERYKAMLHTEVEISIKVPVK